MTTHKEALKLALEHIEGNYTVSDKEAISAIKEALAQLEHLEPVAWMSKDADIVYASIQVDGCFHNDHIPLYTTPPQCKPFNHHEFGYWWFEYGSGLHPLEGEDQEQYAYRVATVAWQAAHGIKE